MRQQQSLDLKQKKEPRQARAQATVQAILQAAAQVLIQEGVAGVFFFVLNQVIAADAQASSGPAHYPSFSEYLLSL